VAVSVKICGLNAPGAVEAAIEGGAAMVGFVFYARSPRSLEPDDAAKLAAMVPPHIGRVGLIVDEDDRRIADILERCPVDYLQLHGDETPGRCRDIKARHGRPLIKAIKLAGPGDLEAVQHYAGCVDFLLFDAKPPPSRKDALPGGNALSFDWTMLKDRVVPAPWLLSGGLNAGNLAQAIAETGARRVDVSSGVEDRPGVKNPNKIKEFLALAQGLGRP
jgi:phosphoribosylanthranilate isomerase